MSVCSLQKLDHCMNSSEVAFYPTCFTTKICWLV